MMAPRFLVIFLYLVWFSLCSSFFWELRDNGVLKNLHFDPKQIVSTAPSSCK